MCVIECVCVCVCVCVCARVMFDGTRSLTFDFDSNKKVTEEIAVLPSKRIRNKISGYVTVRELAAAGCGIIIFIGGVGADSPSDGSGSTVLPVECAYTLSDADGDTIAECFRVNSLYSPPQSLLRA